MFNKLCIIGPGLIGGSIARAARQQRLCNTVSSFGRLEDQANLAKAKELGVIDEFFIDDVRSAVAGVDCVIIATPVGAIESIITLLKPHWQDEVIYTDVGSTKANVIQAAQRIFGFIPDNFIPAHPVAGAELSGVMASVSDLFTNKRLIMTPVENTSPDLINKLAEFWRRLGALVNIMTAEHHDAVFAATSHLPHILSFALVHMLGRRDEQSEIFQYAAGGFRDFSRIASSDPTMWLDICQANKNEIIPLLQNYVNELNDIRDLIEAGNNKKLFETFSYARQSRQRFLDINENLP